MSDGILDTSVLIAISRSEPIDLAALPGEVAISVMSLAELLVGVLLSRTPSENASRIEYLHEVRHRYDALPVDEEVANKYADLKANARREGRTIGVIDLLIAATAKSLDLPLYTKDRGFDWMPGVQVVQV